ncbi:MAG: hypothetical protein AAGG68_06325 [Bacteroidota bacterium]
MKSPYLAKTLLLLGLITWGLSENNLINGDVSLKNEIEVFDHDLGDHKLFPHTYKLVVDWGNQKFTYGTGCQTITLKPNSKITYDLSWSPFFKNYYQSSIWTVEGLNFERAPIDLKMNIKRYGLVSRSEMRSEMRLEATRQLLKTFQSQTFYDSPFLNTKSRFIFSRC